MKTFNLLVLILLPCFLLAQDQYETLENAYISVPIHNGNKHFQTSFNDGGFTIKSEGANTTFTSSLWLSGYDPAGNAFLSAQTYSPQTIDNGLTGPIDPNTGGPYADLTSVFNRFFEVTNDEIQAFLADFADGSIDNDIPANLLIWPAVGNPYFFDFSGEELPNHPGGLAPFFDQDGDGLYDPANGDYPLIKGASQAFYYVYHFGPAIGQSIPSTRSEVQVLARIYEAANSIGHTAFFDYKLIQTKFEDLRNFRIAMFVDPDLGCYADDYLGYNEECEFMYAYNQDALDGTDEQGGCDGVPIPVFENEIPIMAYSFIKKPEVFINQEVQELKTDFFIAYNSLNPISSLPSTQEGYLQNLNGTWLDNTPITFGGDGLNFGSIDSVNFCYPGNPADVNGWSACTASVPQSERRALLGLEDFTFPPGGVVEFTFAAFAHMGAELPCPDITETSSICEEIKAFNANSTTVSTTNFTLSDCLVLPNVVTPGESVNLKCESLPKQMAIFNSSGKLIKNFYSEQNHIFSAPTEKGMYFIKLTDNNGLAQTQKLIVQ